MSTTGVPDQSNPKAPTQQLVKLRNSWDEELVGVLDDPGSDDVGIVCHGFASTRESGVVTVIAKGLNQAGISSFRFDFSGNGDSEGTFEFGNYAREVEDIRVVSEYCRNVLKKNIVALIGHSKGGNDVILYAAKYDDIPKVVNVSGRFDCKEGITQRFGGDIHDRLKSLGQIPMTTRASLGEISWVLTKESMDERLATDMAEACRHIKCSQVLTVHGTADTTIPYQDALKFDGLIGGHQLVLVEGADHNFRATTHAQELTEAVVSFVMK